jgi:hypothetical protein
MPVDWARVWRTARRWWRLTDPYGPVSNLPEGEPPARPRVCAACGREHPSRLAVRVTCPACGALLRRPG